MTRKRCGKASASGSHISQGCAVPHTMRSGSPRGRRTVERPGRPRTDIDQHLWASLSLAVAVRCVNSVHSAWLGRPQVHLHRFSGHETSRASAGPASPNRLHTARRVDARTSQWAVSRPQLRWRTHVAPATKAHCSACTRLSRRRLPMRNRPNKHLAGGSAKAARGRPLLWTRHLGECETHAVGRLRTTISVFAPAFRNRSLLVWSSRGCPSTAPSGASG